jgi:hypothetical protein
MLMNENYLEPVEFIFNPVFLSGFERLVIENTVVIDNLDMALRYAFDQEIDPEAKIWSDLISDIRSKLRFDSNFQEANETVERRVIDLQNQHSFEMKNYRMKKIKKINTQYDDFLFSDAREDAFSVLSTVAIGRCLGGGVYDSLLERIFSVYKEGGWPCGMSGNDLLVFNPRVLKV